MGSNESYRLLLEALPHYPLEIRKKTIEHLMNDDNFKLTKKEWHHLKKSNMPTEMREES